jgi:hypothetical protein
MRMSIHSGSTGIIRHPPTQWFTACSALVLAGAGPARRIALAMMKPTSEMPAM